MKWSFNILIFVILISSSCNKEIELINEHSHLDFRVKKIKNYNRVNESQQLYKYTEDDKIDSIFHSNPRIIVCKYRQFFISEVESYYSESLSYRDSLVYTNSRLDKIYREEFVNPHLPSLKYTIEFEYNDERQIVKRKFNFENIGVVSTEDYVWENGNVISVISYDQNLNPNIRYEYKYDTSHNFKNLIYNNINIYDPITRSKNNIVEMSTTYLGGNFVDFECNPCKWEFVYNEYGLPIKSKYLESFGDTITNFQEIEYELN